jgi:hypothetical protein
MLILPIVCSSGVASAAIGSTSADPSRRPTLRRSSPAAQHQQRSRVQPNNALAGRAGLQDGQPSVVLRQDWVGRVWHPIDLLEAATTRQPGGRAGERMACKPDMHGRRRTLSGADGTIAPTQPYSVIRARRITRWSSSRRTSPGSHHAVSPTSSRLDGERPCDDWYLVVLRRTAVLR